MKKDIHPTYFVDAKIICSCKNVIVAGSTKEEQNVEICSACHPFYTGKQKMLDTAGRVNKFLERQKKAEEKKGAKK
jgi:large subunit ribosomal protein L31